jgi:hypothetical protein
MKNANRNKTQFGLKGGPNHIDTTMQGYQQASPHRFNPMNVIPSGRITMQNVPHPVLGIDNFGNQQMMQPGGEYMFPGSMVNEFPIRQNGGPMPPEELPPSGDPNANNTAMRSEMDQFDQQLALQTKFDQQRAAYLAEVERVKGLSPELLSNAQTKDEGNIPTRTDLGWIDSGKYFCSSHTCELLGDSGYTIPQDFSQGSRSYKAGDKIPLIPGNAQFESMAPMMGFEKIGSQADAQPGDVVQITDYMSHDYQGNPVNRMFPHHSMIYKGDNQFYNAPGGARENYAISDYDLNDQEFQGWRYVGNTPELERQFLETQKELVANPMELMPTRPIAKVPTQFDDPNNIPQIDPKALYNQEITRINNSDMSKRKKKQALKQLDNNMELGNQYAANMSNRTAPVATFKEGGENWIQGVSKDIKKRGTEGKCTGSNFGGSGCPPGSPQYNLAQTFRKMAKARKKQFGGATNGAAPQNTTTDDITKYRKDMMQNHLAQNNYDVMVQQEADAVQAMVDQQVMQNQMNQQQYMMARGGQPCYECGGQHMQYGGNPYNPYGRKTQDNTGAYVSAYSDMKGQHAQDRKSFGNAAINFTNDMFGISQQEPDYKLKTKTKFVDKDAKNQYKDYKKNMKNQDNNQFTQLNNQLAGYQEGQPINMMDLNMPNMYPPMAYGGAYPFAQMQFGGQMPYNGFYQEGGETTSPNGRFTYRQTPQGMITIDNQTGSSSLRREDGMIMQLPDRGVGTDNKFIGEAGPADPVNNEGAATDAANWITNPDGSLTQKATQPVYDPKTNTWVTPGGNNPPANGGNSGGNAGGNNAGGTGTGTTAEDVDAAIKGDPVTGTDADGARGNYVEPEVDPNAPVTSDPNNPNAGVFVTQPTYLNPGNRWNRGPGRGYAAGPAIAYNAQDTYLDEYTYKKALFGKGPRKVKMKFSHTGKPIMPGSNTDEDGNVADPTIQDPNTAMDENLESKNEVSAILEEGMKPSPDAVEVTGLDPNQSVFSEDGPNSIMWNQGNDQPWNQTSAPTAPPVGPQGEAYVDPNIPLDDHQMLKMYGGQMQYGGVPFHEAFPQAQRFPTPWRGAYMQFGGDGNPMQYPGGMNTPNMVFPNVLQFGGNAPADAGNTPWAETTGVWTKDNDQMMGAIGKGLDPAMNWVASLGEQSKLNKIEDQMQARMLGDNMFMAEGYGDVSRGKHTVNRGEFDPRRDVVVQDQGMNMGQIGSNQVQFAYGGGYPMAQMGMDIKYDRYMGYGPQVGQPAARGAAPQVGQRVGQAGAQVGQRVAAPTNYLQQINQGPPVDVDGNGQVSRQEAVQYMNPPQLNFGGGNNYQGYQQGGEYYLSDNEIQAIMQAGGQVEYY